jgi:YfiH family protein
METIQPDWSAAPANVRAVVTLRSGGVSAAPYDDGNGAGGLNLGTHVGDDLLHVEQNRRQLRQLLPTEPAWLSQVHGATVLDAAQLKDAPPADASIATRPGVVCAILSADCLPVLFCDRAGRTVAAAHAGWRGLAGGVLERTIEAMRSAGAGEILAWLGPAIGPQAFEVGQDVFDAFAGQDAELRHAFVPVPQRIDKYHADIYLLARARLRNAGIDSVQGGGLCTYSDRQRFYSYRRDGVAGRFGSFIWLV